MNRNTHFDILWVSEIDLILNEPLEVDDIQLIE